MHYQKIGDAAAPLPPVLQLSHACNTLIILNTLCGTVNMYIFSVSTQIYLDTCVHIYVYKFRSPKPVVNSKSYTDVKKNPISAYVSTLTFISIHKY